MFLMNWLTWGESVVLAILFLMLFWWIAETIPMAVTALLPLVILPISGVMNLEKLAPVYGDKFVFLFLGGFLLALAIEKHGLHKRLAFALLDVAGDRKSSILFAVMISSYILSMWISNTATALMFMPIAASVAMLLSKREGEGKLKRALVLGVAYAASIGGMATIIGTPPNVAAVGIVEKQFGESITFFDWMKIGIPFSLVLLIAVFYALKYMHFSNSEKIRGAHDSLHELRSELGAWSIEQRRVLIVFIVAVLAWIFQQPISDSLNLPGFNDTFIALVAGMILFFLPSSDHRERLLDWRDTKELNWGVLLMFGGGLAISMAFKEVGLLDRMVVILSSASAWSSEAYLILLCGVGLILTALMSNLAMVTIFVPIVGVLATKLGMEVSAFVVPVTLAASCDFMFPMSTPPNAIAYGTGWVKAREMFGIGIIVNLLAFLFLCILVWMAL
jgi:sodium-dependent dicarboxylate transporter 2/3/5